jgi:hypothetical protein
MTAPCTHWVVWVTPRATVDAVTNSVPLEYGTPIHLTGRPARSSVGADPRQHLLLQTVNNK